MLYNVYYIIKVIIWYAVDHLTIILLTDADLVYYRISSRNVSYIFGQKRRNNKANYFREWDSEYSQEW